MNIAIVDDLEADRQLLSKYVARYCGQHQISVNVSQHTSGEQFLSVFSQTSFDLIFLDIYMGALDGIQTAEKIRETDQNCLLVFTTTSTQHAIKSYRVRAFDYLVKPYQYEQFEEIMQLCDKALLNHARYIEVKESRESVRILLRDILYADYSNHYIQIHTTQRIIKTYGSFAEFSKTLLLYPQFLYCYRNIIINMDKVDALDIKDFLMQNGERIPIARAQRTRVRECYADYAFQKLDDGT